MDFKSKDIISGKKNCQNVQPCFRGPSFTSLSFSIFIPTCEDSSLASCNILMVFDVTIILQIYFAGTET